MGECTGLHAPAVAAAKRFLFAVSIGDGDAVWEELSERARAYVLNVAVRQGMDFDLGSRLRSGEATEAEVATYRQTLVRGLQKDLAGIDLSNLVYEAAVEEGGGVRVRYAVPIDLQRPVRGGEVDDGPPTSIPAGSVVTSHEPEGWRTDHLVPRPG